VHGPDSRARGRQIRVDAFVRIRIGLPALFIGRVNDPVYVTPAARRIVSPGWDWSIAA